MPLLPRVASNLGRPGIGRWITVGLAGAVLAVGFGPAVESPAQAASPEASAGISASPRPEATLPVELKGTVRLTEPPGVSPPVPWVPVASVAEEGFLVSPGEQLLAIDQEVLLQWMADRRLAIEVAEAKLEVARQDLEARLQSAADEVMELQIRDQELQANRALLIGDPEHERSLAAARLAQQEARVALARRRYAALQAQAENGFADEPALQAAQRRLDEALTELPVLREIQADIGQGDQQDALALVDIERRLLAMQLRRGGMSAEKIARLRRQLQARLQLDGRRLTKLNHDHSRDQRGLAEAKQVSNRAGLVVHRRGGVRPGMRLPASEAVRVGDVSHLRLEVAVPAAVAAYWRQHPSANIVVETVTGPQQGVLDSLSLRLHRRRPAQTIAQLRLPEADLRLGQEVDVRLHLPMPGWSLPQWAVGPGGRVRDTSGQVVTLLGWQCEGRFYIPSWASDLHPEPSAVRLRPDLSAAAAGQIWATVQPAATVPVQAPRSRHGGYFTSVVADATVVEVGDVIATIHAHWRPTAPQLRREIDERRKNARAQLEIDVITNQQQRDNTELQWLRARVQAQQSANTERQAGRRLQPIAMAQAEAAFERARITLAAAQDAVERYQDPIVQRTVPMARVRERQLTQQRAELTLQRRLLDRAAARRSRDLNNWLWRQRGADADVEREVQARNAYILSRQRYQNSLLQAIRRYRDDLRRVDWSRRALRNLTVKAPVSGTAYRQIVDGRAVEAGTEIRGKAPLVIVTDDSMQAVAEIPEMEYLRWAAGTEVVLALPGGQQVATTVADRSPFCHSPRWRAEAWPGERVATVVVPLPVTEIAAGQQVQIYLQEEP